MAPEEHLTLANSSVSISNKDGEMLWTTALKGNALHQCFADVIFFHRSFSSYNSTAREVKSEPTVHVQ